MLRTLFCLFLFHGAVSFLRVPVIPDYEQLSHKTSEYGPNVQTNGHADTNLETC